jgi:hypothetical protein
MGMLYDRSKLIKIQEVGNTIFIAESLKTPMTRLMKRGKKPKDMLCTWPVQAFPRRAFIGTMDGADLSSFESTNRDKMEAYAMWLRTAGFMVGHIAELTAAAGVSDELVKQKMDDGLILAQMMERQIGSSVDTQAEASPATPYRSRGVFSWVNTAEQSTKPVPASYRPAAACAYTSALGSFTAASFSAMLQAAATQKREPVELMGFAGLKLKTQMSTWAQKVTLSSNEVALQQFNLAAEEKRLQNVVDVFEFDAGRVKVVPSFYLACNEADGADTEYTPRSGVFLDMDMWELAFVEAPSLYELPDLGGGPRGAHGATFILKGLNPLGSCYVLTNTDS